MTNAERVCHVGIFVSLALLTVGVGVCVFVETSLPDFLIVVAGLLIGWLTFFYCLGQSPVWGD